jgi:thiosulfate/3-mercaptopyruvate sulfurtransferase
VRRKLVIGTGSITLVLVLVAVLVVGAGVQANSPEIDAIVSTQWLEENLEDPDLVILDVRTPDEYTAGHIPGAVNSPEADWYINPPFGPDVPWMELPEVDDLEVTIGNAGITGESLVVIVSRTVDPFALYAIAGATRVAVTLLYAGVENVAILDGGWDKWAAEGKDTSTVPVTPAPVTYEADVNEAMFVTMDYVEERIGRIWRYKIVDGRDVDVYFGVTLEYLWTAYPGHIPSATSLPVPWLCTFDEEGIGTYKDIDVLGEMASGVVGRQVCGWWGCLPREIIATCGVGGYASTVYFVLSEVLGYENVKIYDGAAQEWTAEGKPVNLYMWD